MTTEGELRSLIREALRSLDEATEAALRRELAAPIDLGHSERLQLEACPYFFGVKLVQTEEELVADSAVTDAIPEEVRAAAAAADLDLLSAVAEELPLWLAERWRAAGGPGRYSPAYLLFHGGLEAPRFDLERRRWCAVAEVWPDEAGE